MVHPRAVKACVSVDHVVQRGRWPNGSLNFHEAYRADIIVSDKTQLV